MFTAGDGENGDYEGVDEGPDEAGDGVEVVAEELERETRGVVDCNVISQHREDKQD
jgi:hypothetical protein